MAANQWSELKILVDANYVKFIEERVMCTAKKVFVEKVKMFTNELNMDFLLWARVEKTIRGLSGKKKSSRCSG